MKIIDCFIFYNELSMLKFRLKELNDIVDYFVIVEANLTFQGKEKEYYFQNNINLFSEYINKIIYIKVEDIPNTNNGWDREHYQRNCIDRGISKINLNDDDIIIITDVDEIPDTNTLNIIKKNGLSNLYSYTLVQELYYYNFNCKNEILWFHPKILNYYVYKNIFNRNCENIRMSRKDFTHYDIQKGGWHLSFFGDKNYIINKIKNFSHIEYNNETYLNEDKIIECIKNNKDLFFRNERDVKFKYQDIESNTYLPNNYKLLLDIKNY